MQVALAYRLLLPCFRQQQPGSHNCSGADETAFTMRVGELDLFDEDEDEQPPSQSARRKRTSEIPQSVAARLEGQRYRVEECKKALDKMLRN